MNLIRLLTTFINKFRRRPGKCYGYDEGLGSCLIWGIDCDQNESYQCFHTKRDRYIIFDPKQVKKIIKKIV